MDLGFQLLDFRFVMKENNGKAAKIEVMQVLGQIRDEGLNSLS